MTHHVKPEWNEDKAILDSMKDDILVTNPDGIILRASKMTAEIYEIALTELIGQSVYDLEQQGLFTPILTPIVLKEKKKITLVQKTNLGKKLLVTGIPVFNPDGDLVRIVSFSHDITELMNLKSLIQTMEEDMERVKSELYMLRNRHLSTEGIIANSLEMSKIIEIATRVAEIDVNVLLLGESGVGKSLIAKFIHNKSPRCNGPFIEVNCGAIPETLFESEFFGYEAGAFTGASRSGKIGLAELAEGGTLFLDEIGELSMPHQVKLLKFIQEKQFFRIGGTKPRTVDFRLIAATNQDLEHLVKNKKFREDLYFRLNVVPVTIPPLRKRKEDILPMIDHFLHQFEKKYDRQRKLHEAVIHDLLQYDWKGNTRELINLMEHLVVLSPSTLVTREHLPQHIKSSYTPLPDFDDKTRTLPEILADVEKQYLTAAKKRYKTTTEIARASGISQPSVVRKLKRYKIE